MRPVSSMAPIDVVFDKHMPLEWRWFLTINPYLPSGLFHFIKWTSQFPVLGVPGVILFGIEIPVSKQCRS